MVPKRGAIRCRVSGDTSAQSALIDAFLFFLIMVLASIFLNLSGLTAVDEVVMRRDDMGYSRDALSTLLRCTVNRSNYTVSREEGEVDVELLDRNVAELLVEDLSVRTCDEGIDEKSVELGLEAPIRSILDNLTSTVLEAGGQVPLYDYMLRCKYGNITVNITRDPSGAYPDPLPLVRFSADTELHMPTGPGRAGITLLVWSY